ncbi:MAG TPA: (4Fe-4S)-binding protein [Leptospiraceae bacterium]|nr:(4Fe-4S)-binding protein [Leptospiraceae bacterium]HMW08181.1 (4Fe-4S)-binding protein [Leptospiraceae bacterium]HMX35270.1 (4Fe-4S)-binding protein [Leptospiraceae bacterium]HMY33984.1 (4Fe-4S)-binding protein [Leptospiraceae bacterium]HMZ66510.1 (4Fe-4S)-binding protein [Leptospiraceae bacterium]
MENEIEKKYTNQDITVIWKPKVCIHSAVCFKGLPGVFNPKKRPWVTIEGATSEEIMAQIDKCPSGALSYVRNDSSGIEEETIKTQVEVMNNGPLLVYGTIEVKDKEGNKTLKNKTTAFCRCGHSGNKPFCDGSHVKQGFKG